jgi:excinuclease UvrABC nuclease subunit
MYNSITLDFDGYYEEDDLPPKNHDCSGIYVVYRGKNKSPSELLYIGRSGDVADRPSSKHHKYKDWKKNLQSNEVLYFSFTDIDNEELAEAALIFKIKPDLNDKLKNNFNHYETRVKTSGKNAFIDDYFVVKQTN